MRVLSGKRSVGANEASGSEQAKEKRERNPTTGWEKRASRRGWQRRQHAHVRTVARVYVYFEDTRGKRMCGGGVRGRREMGRDEERETKSEMRLRQKRLRRRRRRRRRRGRKKAGEEEGASERRREARKRRRGIPGEIPRMEESREGTGRPDRAASLVGCTEGRQLPAGLPPSRIIYTGS